MKKVGLLVGVIAVTFGYTQAPDTLWTKTYGGTDNDIGYSVLQTNDGGYIIVGSTESFGAGGKDGYIIRANANGDTIWTRCYGGSEDDEFFDIKPTLDGQYIIAGYTASFGNGGADIWLLEVDSLGDTLGTGTFGGSGDDVGYSVEPTSDGGYVVTGYVPMGFVHTVFLMKTHLDGWYDWMRTYFPSPNLVSVGNVVKRTYDGGYIIAADAWRYEDWGVWLWLIKTDADGDTTWTKVYYPGDIGRRDARVLEVVDGYVIAALVGGTSLLKTDANGDSVWAKVIYPESDGCNSLQRTSDSGYVSTGGIREGTLPSDIVLIKADANGDSLWNTTYGGTEWEEGYSVQETSDNGFIIVGSTESYGAGGSDVYLIKTEPDVSVEEQPIVKPVEKRVNLSATIFSGPLQLPEGKQYKVFDVTGRVVAPDKITRGIYFIEIDGVVTQKVVKVR